MRFAKKSFFFWIFEYFFKDINWDQMCPEPKSPQSDDFR